MFYRDGDSKSAADSCRTTSGKRILELNFSRHQARSLACAFCPRHTDGKLDRGHLGVLSACAQPMMPCMLAELRSDNDLGQGKSGLSSKKLLQEYGSRRRKLAHQIIVPGAQGAGRPLETPLHPKAALGTRPWSLAWQRCETCVFFARVHAVRTCWNRLMLQRPSHDVYLLTT